MTVETLPPRAIDGHVPTSTGNDDHPMRHMTRRVAGLEPGEWDADARAEVAALFDSLAPEWHTRSSPERTEVVADALDRGLGDEAPRGAAVELGSGIGFYSGLLAERFEPLLAVELSREMHARAPAAPARRVLADAGRLPVPDGTLDAVVAINMFLFPHEVARVLRPGGALVWVNSSGENTPIHLSTAEVVAALPFPVSGVESRAGAGTWCVLRRAD